MPAFAGLAALVWAARSGRRRAWVAAGRRWPAPPSSIRSSTASSSSPPGALTTLALGLLERRWRTVAKTTPAFLAGAALAAVPFLWRLAQHDAVKPFLRASFRELPRTISDVWGLPAVSAVPIARDGSARTFARALLFGEALPWALSRRGPRARRDRPPVALRGSGPLAHRPRRRGRHVVRDPRDARRPGSGRLRPPRDARSLRRPSGGVARLPRLARAALALAPRAGARLVLVVAARPGEPRPSPGAGSADRMFRRSACVRWRGDARSFLLAGRRARSASRLDGRSARPVRDVLRLRQRARALLLPRAPAAGPLSVRAVLRKRSRAA